MIRIDKKAVDYYCLKWRASFFDHVKAQVRQVLASDTTA